MAFYSVCLSRRSLLSLSSSLLHRNLNHQHHHLYGASSRGIAMLVSSTSTNVKTAERRPPAPRSNSSHLLQMQWFRFKWSLPSHLKNGEIRDGKLYKFDNNHWIVYVNFVGDEDISSEEMVEIYVSMAARVLGSVEEAKKRIYSWDSNDCYNYCFHVNCSWDKFRIFFRLPGVSWVTPDQSYLKPVSKKQQNRIAESKKHRKKPILCKKRVIISAGPSSPI